MLLNRSIKFGHRRLAVIRYSVAITIGASVDERQRIYCENAALSSRDSKIIKLFLAAAANK